MYVCYVYRERVYVFFYMGLRTYTSMDEAVYSSPVSGDMSDVTIMKSFLC